MNKISWCMEQRKGIRLTDLKPHLSDAYIREADETLENFLVAQGKWKIITAYYACYNALYAILMKYGIRCEIHDCSIELMPLLKFTAKETAYLRKLKKDRIGVQYYLKNIELKNEPDVKKFVLRCKFILNSATSADIERIRTTLKQGAMHEA